MSDSELFGSDDRNQVFRVAPDEVRSPRVREVPDRDEYRSIRLSLRVAHDFVPRGFHAVSEVAHADVCNLGIGNHVLIVSGLTAFGSPPVRRARPSRNSHTHR